ncbi:nucleotidyltransferase domain-containing protein [Evansella sp. AB-rgal1]|uniref:nucleotidyltransferase domain-containing protein n=1 Tax=Evansella sp. AB-rgal1 TaxID=3242696 RepID=UPI00359E33F5
MGKLQPLEAASQFIFSNHSTCDGAILAGSVVRGEGTPTSDLDIVIFDSSLLFPFRESIMFKGWPIEIFAHNLHSYKEIFKEDLECAMPTHQKMVAEGIVLVDRGIVTPIKKEALQMLQNGPEPWSKEQIELKRYFLTDALDDFIGSADRSEAIFIANTLATWIHEFVLRTNGCWIGESKWLVRALRNYDETFTEQFVTAFEDFYQTGRKEKIIELTDLILNPYGGRLFHGFSMGKI